MLFRLAEGPLSLISVLSSERSASVKGAPLLRGLRTLDGFALFWNLVPEGKGAGGLRGLAPWRSLRQRLMRASRAPPSPAIHRSPSLHTLLGSCFCPLTSPRLCRHASIRTLVAASAAGACWCSQFQGCCHLIAELQGSSCPVPLVLPRPRSHPNSAHSHTPQKSNPFQFPSLCCGFLGPLTCLCRLTVVLRVVHLPRYPQMVQQHRQLPCHGHGCFLLPTLALFLPSSRSYLRQPPRLQIAIRRSLPQDAVRGLHQLPSH